MENPVIKDWPISPNHNSLLFSYHSNKYNIKKGTAQYQAALRSEKVVRSTKRWHSKNESEHGGNPRNA